jgi:DNA-binding response OmpR family regulator
LLLTLAERAGEVVDYITLVQLSLDYQAEPWEAKELIKRHVFSLRQKIEPEPSAPRYILNVRGIGYRIATTRELE